MTAPSDTPEFSHPVSVSRLPKEPSVYRLQAKPAERVALAARFGLISLERLEAEVTLRPAPGGMIRLDATLEADVVQACVVTLDPVEAKVVDTFALLYGDVSEEDEILLGDDELVTEPLENDVIDLGEAVAQQLSLALDPYPRSPAAVALEEGPQDSDEVQRSPFAGLAERFKTGPSRKN